MSAPPLNILVLGDSHVSWLDSFITSGGLADRFGELEGRACHVEYLGIRGATVATFLNPNMRAKIESFHPDAAVLLENNKSLHCKIKCRKNKRYFFRPWGISRPLACGATAIPLTITLHASHGCQYYSNIDGGDTIAQVVIRGHQRRRNVTSAQKLSRYWSRVHSWDMNVPFRN